MGILDKALNQVKKFKLPGIEPDIKTFGKIKCLKCGNENLLISGNTLYCTKCD